MSRLHFHVFERRYHLQVDDPQELWRLLQEKTGFKNRFSGKHIALLGSNLPPETPGRMLSFVLKEGVLEICYRLEFNLNDRHMPKTPEELDLHLCRLLSRWGIPTEPLIHVTTPYFEVFAAIPTILVPDFVAQHPAGLAETTWGEGKTIHTVVEQKVTFRGLARRLDARGVLYTPHNDQTPEVTKIELRNEPDLSKPGRKKTYLHRFPEYFQDADEHVLVDGFCWHLRELLERGGYPMAQVPGLWDGSPINWKAARMGKRELRILAELAAYNAYDLGIVTIQRTLISIQRASLAQATLSPERDARRNQQDLSKILLRMKKKGWVNFPDGRSGPLDKVYVTPRGLAIIFARILKGDKE